MTSFFIKYDKNFKAVSSAVNLGGTTPMEGIYWDGFFFWICQGSNIKKYFLRNRTMYLIKTLDLSAILGDVTDYPKCITGDGLHLFVGLSYGVGFPTLARESIIKITKDGKLLKNYTSAVRNSPENEYEGLTYDGLKVYGSYSDGGTPNTSYIKALDITHDKADNIYSDTRAIISLDTNGQQWIFGRSNNLWIFDKDISVPISLGATARAARGLCNDGEYWYMVA
jgi:hypothetical protein